jgi:FtsZ-interacting cell division protein ZipA
MSTGAIIAIVIAALIVLAILWLVGRQARERRLDTRRDQAREIRREAEVGRAQADRTHAEADERAARARREEATAREQKAHAEAQQREARDQHMQAASVDPDVDEREAADRYDRGDIEGVTSHGHGEDGDGVEHHEQTVTPGEERERHFERDDEGDVVRDEELRRPRT